MPTQTRRRMIVKGPFQARIVLRFGVAVLVTTALAAAALVAYFWLRCQALHADVQLYVVVPGESPDFQKIALSSLVVPPLFVTAVISVLAAGLSAFYFSHRIAGPIFRLEKEMDEVARGNLTASLRFRGRDELKEVADHFSRMTRGLSEELRSIKEEAANLGATVEAFRRETEASPAIPAPVRELTRALASIASRLRDRLDRFQLR